MRQIALILTIYPRLTPAFFSMRCRAATGLATAGRRWQGPRAKGL